MRGKPWAGATPARHGGGGVCDECGDNPVSPEDPEGKLCQKCLQTVMAEIPYHEGRD